MANIYVSSVAWTAVPQWTSSTAITSGTIRRQTAPAAGNERCFRCTTGGTTGSTEPTWILTANSTTNDGTVVWTECTGQAAFNGDGGGTAWGAPHARLVPANTFSTAGDTIYVASNHAETGTYTNALSIVGTATARTRILSIDKDATPITSAPLKDGASLTNTNNTASSITGSATTTGYVYLYGITFNQTNTTTATITLANGNSDIIADTCRFNFSNGPTSGSGLVIGQAGISSATTNRVTLKNCFVKFSNTVQGIVLRGASTTIQNLTVDSSGTAPAILFRVPTNNTAIMANVQNSDLSFVTGTLFDINNGSNTFVNLFLANCQLGSGVTLPTAAARPGYFFEMDNCDSSGTNSRFYQLSSVGYAQQTTGTTVNGYAIQATTLTTACWESPFTMSLTPIRVQAGTAYTLTYEIAGASQLTNADIWIDISYTAGNTNPKATIATSGTANIRTAGTNYPASSATWSGSPANKQTITVTFTPQLTGWALPVLNFAKASTTEYIDLGQASLLPTATFANNPAGLLIHPGMAGGMRG